MTKRKKFIIIALVIAITTSSLYKQAKAVDVGLILTITSCVIGTSFKIADKVLEYRKNKLIEQEKLKKSMYIENIITP